VRSAIAGRDLLPGQEDAALQQLDGARQRTSVKPSSNRSMAATGHRADPGARICRL
jgi:hypothetical protein